MALQLIFDEAHEYMRDDGPPISRAEILARYDIEMSIPVSLLILIGFVVACRVGGYLVLSLKMRRVLQSLSADDGSQLAQGRDHGLSGGDSVRGCGLKRIRGLRDGLKRWNALLQGGLGWRVMGRACACTSNTADGATSSSKDGDAVGGSSRLSSRSLLTNDSAEMSLQVALA